jgi:hypothetical protein
LKWKILCAPQLDEFLCLVKGTVEITFCDLHSVLSVTEDVERPWIYFHRKSLEDFLCSPQRAGNLYQSQTDTYSDILTVCVQNTELWDWKLVDSNADFHVVRDILLYSAGAWQLLFILKKCFPPSVLDFDTRIARRFLTFAGTVLLHIPVPDDFIGSFHSAIVG